MCSSITIYFRKIAAQSSFLLTTAHRDPDIFGMKRKALDSQLGIEYTTSEEEWWIAPRPRVFCAPVASPPATAVEEEEEEDSLGAAYSAAASYASDVGREGCETGALCNVVLDSVVRVVGREAMSAGPDGVESQAYEYCMAQVLRDMQKQHGVLLHDYLKYSTAASKNEDEEEVDSCVTSTFMATATEAQERAVLLMAGVPVEDIYIAPKTCRELQKAAVTRAHLNGDVWEGYSVGDTSSIEPPASTGQRTAGTHVSQSDDSVCGGPADSLPTTDSQYCRAWKMVERIVSATEVIYIPPRRPVVPSPVISSV